MADNEFEDAQNPAIGAGARLKAAREAAGLSLADIAAHTKIPERLLVLIETGNFAALPAKTYATGFARTYAKAVGLDQQEIVAEVRRELGMSEAVEHRTTANFEPGDPARVPTARFAWVAGLGAILVIGAGLFFWRSYYAPAVTLPSILPEPTETAVPAPTATPVAVASTPAPNGPVVFTALAEGIWVKFYDQTGKQLLQKQMALGETYTLPADVQGPQLWTGRPEELAITIGGQPVPKLSETQKTMKDVAVSAEALRARKAAPAVVPPAVVPTAGALPTGAAGQSAQPGTAASTVPG
jgi:cytoskeletal protein RodZ